MYSKLTAMISLKDRGYNSLGSSKLLSQLTLTSTSNVKLTLTFSHISTCSNKL